MTINPLPVATIRDRWGTCSPGLTGIWLGMVRRSRHARAAMPVRMILLVLSLLALAVMPVRAASITWLHQQPVRVAVMDPDMAFTAQTAAGECPLHAALHDAPSDQKGGDHDHDNRGATPMAKGAGACCVAWCVSPALPVSLAPLRFPPPSGFLLPAGLPGPDGRQDSPPLRPPRA